MKNKELFDKTVGILVKAYQNDTLRHNDCTACAVGNIVSANIGKKLSEEKAIGEYPYWFKPMYFNGFVFDRPRYINNNLIDENVLYQIISTGYSIYNLAKIEFAFESADRGENQEDWMFNGLIAVYNVLCEIHEIVKEEVEKPELVFVK